MLESIFGKLAHVGQFPGSRSPPTYSFRGEFRNAKAALRPHYCQFTDVQFRDRESLRYHTVTSHASGGRGTRGHPFAWLGRGDVHKPEWASSTPFCTLFTVFTWLRHATDYALWL